MRRFGVSLVGGLVGLFLVSMPQAEAVSIFNGTLTTSGGGLVGTGQWATNSSISWDVSFDNGTNEWTYAYTLITNPSDPKGISHSIIELSPNFTDDDALPGTSPYDEIQVHTGDGTDTQPQPFMPENVYGIKFDGDDDSSSQSFQIVTLRAPVCGDFYSKDGSSGGPSGVPVTLFNAGFTSPDTDSPIDFNDSQSCVSADELVVPDTETGCPHCPPPPPEPIIPEPASLLLLGTGLMGLLGVGRFSKRV